jgi:hypothetical protein
MYRMLSPETLGDLWVQLSAPCACPTRSGKKCKYHTVVNHVGVRVSFKQLILYRGGGGYGRTC